jgi:dUTP pyrophosphatase
MDIRVKKVSETAVIPKYAYVGDSGFDLSANESVTICPGETKLIGTGLAFSIPENLEMQIRPRSGMSAKSKFRICNSPGTVDSNFTGEIKIIGENIGSRPIFIEKGDRIAQGVICPVIRANFIVIEDLDKTERSENGFGSSGIK